MIVLNMKSDVDIYEQIVENFRELIIKGVLKADDKLPSVRSLASQLAINPNTIQKAYKELEHREYVYSIKGKGNFVMDASDLIDDKKINKVKNQLEKSILEAKFLKIDKTYLSDKINEVYGKGDSK